ncbi:hypothetical protein AVEN_60538-1 [Araneus ventricosus]|uniref:Uncharacterized protein n=1 Tax=Araneus ventricosus TaxID=182803 RepID=A0A4Y2II49_ARAVE|nr:hypothetical protein AVEN_60538-1 [Araneus ventricosus]
MTSFSFDDRWFPVLLISGSDLSSSGYTSRLVLLRTDYCFGIVASLHSFTGSLIRLCKTHCTLSQTCLYYSGIHSARRRITRHSNNHTGNRVFDQKPYLLEVHPRLHGLRSYGQIERWQQYAQSSDSSDKIKIDGL